MRVLGLDIGSVRVGVAVSDPTGAVASPLAVLDARALRSDPAPLVRIAADYGVESLVVGMPLTLSGDEGPQAVETRAAAARFSEAIGVELHYQDERNSSIEAKRTMRAAGLSEKEQRGAVDKVAAAIMLQAWLDRRIEAGDK